MRALHRSRLKSQRISRLPCLNQEINAIHLSARVRETLLFLMIVSGARAPDLPESVRDAVSTPENFVCTGMLGNAPLNLKYMIRQLRGFGAEFNGEKFSAIIMRFEKMATTPRATVLMFMSAKIVCAGCKDEYGALYLMSIVAREVKRRCEIPVKLTNFRVQNVVGCMRLSFNIDMPYLCNTVLPGAAYEPRQFPGAIFKSWLTCLIFPHANVVITGAHSIEEIQKMARELAIKLYAARPAAAAAATIAERRVRPIAPGPVFVSMKSDEVRYQQQEEKPVIIPIAEISEKHMDAHALADLLYPPQKKQRRVHPALAQAVKLEDMPEGDFN
jgi:TATA-box binding protein (TBP) (component of TFIID and TFIIIB)